MCSYSSEQVNQKKCYLRRYVHIAVNRIIKKNGIQEELKSPDYNIRTFFIIYIIKYWIKNKDKV